MNTHEDRSYAGSKLSLNNLKEMKSQNVFLDDKGIKLKVYAGDLPRGARRERERRYSPRLNFREEQHGGTVGRAFEESQCKEIRK